MAHALQRVLCNGSGSLLGDADATLGIFEGNDAGTGDMIFDVAVEDSTAVTADNKWTFDGFVDARATMGESASDLTLLGVHPDTMTQMIKQHCCTRLPLYRTSTCVP